MNRLRLFPVSAFLASLLLLVGAIASLGSDGAAAGAGIDSDGDGFPDDWEINGTPQNLDIAALGADPNRADLFLEIDFMKASFRSQLTCGNLDKIYTMFDRAPINANVAGLTKGITIHIDAGKTCNSRSYDLNGGSKTATNYTQYLIFGCGFEQAFQEAFKPGRATMAAKRLNVFHHAFFADEISQSGGDCDPLGVVRARPGRQLLVGTTEHEGFGPDDDDIERELAATLAHELGHLLGLTHGGGPGEINPFKPNHLSIMDYNQAGGIYKVNGERKFDFQRWAIPTLNESNLNEAVGLGKPYTKAFRAAYRCGTFKLSGRADRNIDWNCNGNASQSGVQANIDGTPETHHNQTPNEWKLITFGGSAQGGGEIGARSAGVERTMVEVEVQIPQPGDEFTLEDRLQNR